MAIDLLPLIKLHKVDAAIQDIRERAAALDPGKSIRARIEFVSAAEEPVFERAKKLHQEQVDLELRQKGIDEKLAKFDKELYGGSIVNPREVEAIQKELQHLREQKSEIESRIIELWEEVPAAKQAADEGEARIQALKQELADHQKFVMQKKSEMEAQFKEQVAARKPLAANVDPNLLKQYETIRDRCGGIGMAEVNAKASCLRCGMSQPERTMIAVKEGKLITCESCHRILYYYEGLS